MTRERESFHNAAVPENNVATCIFCEDHFSNELRGKIYGKYQSCGSSVHLECDEAKNEYNF